MSGARHAAPVFRCEVRIEMTTIVETPPALIPVTSGSGRGPTALAAFDAALFAAGIANYNLVHLTSIVPEGYRPVVQRIDRNEVEFGHRLYVVLASSTATQSGEEAWAGLGWVMTDGPSPWGLFVEHAGASQQAVAAAIHQSLSSMVTYRPERFGSIQQEIIGVTCEGQPACAVVAAVYQSEGWRA
jgi:arginine decarboxylase